MAMESVCVKKTKMEESETKEQVEEGIINISTDRISHLPEELMHQLLSSLLTKDATRMSTLSKKWRSVWFSYPNLDFDQSLFSLDPQNPRKTRLLMKLGNGIQSRIDKNMMRAEKFINYVNNSLQHRLQTKIHKFRVSITDSIHSKIGGIKFSSHMDRWMEFAIENKVQELVVNVPVIVPPRRRQVFVKGFKGRFSLPESVFLSKSLTVLELKGCNLLPFGGIKLTSLKTLSLEDIYAEDGIIQHIISSCPLLEILSLKNCYDLDYLSIFSTRLQILKLEYLELLLQGVNVEAPNLQFFSFLYGQNYEHCEIKAPGLKTLVLEKMKITEEAFQRLISKMPHLENLNLVSCGSLKIFKIYSQQLKSLVVSKCEDLIAADIDAPKLISFKYDGPGLLVSMMNTSSRLKAELCLYPPTIDDYWFFKLRALLSWFGHAQDLTLDCANAQVLIIPKTLRENLVPPLCDLKLLKLKISSEENMNVELTESMLWSCPHLQTLSIDWSPTIEDCPTIEDLETL